MNQPSIEERLPPFSRHLSKSVVGLSDDRALLVVRLEGMPFESIEDDMIDLRFNTLNRVFASLAKSKGSRLSIWTTVRRERVGFHSRFTFKSAFMKQFSSRYLKRFSEGMYFANTFYVSFILKHDDIREGAAELEDLGNQFLKSVGCYDPEILQTYESKGILFSTTYEFIGMLVNGVREQVPVLASPASEIIPSSWLHWGYEILEIRAESRTRFATSYDLKDFPVPTTWGLFDPILALPVEFTLTQSFLCMNATDGQAAIKAQMNKLQSVGDKAMHQHEELNAALGYMAAGELAFGEYHCALTVFGESAKAAGANGTILTSCMLADCGARFVKATLSAPLTYLSHVPGAKIKPRPMIKSSRNLAAAFGMHNYSCGKSEGNPIGDGSAVLPLQTASASLYSFNFHHSREDQDNLGEKFAGHTMILGATGAGKTTLETALIGFLERFDAKTFALDKDEGLKIFINAIGGTYYSLRAGEPTGLAPFQLPDTPRNRIFLYQLVATCGMDSSGKLSAQESNQVKEAVDAVLGLPLIHRRFSRLLENIPDLGGNCLAQRLAKWCAAADGEFAWALDNGAERDLITDKRCIGFDVTEFLVEGYPPTEPLLAYLFHLKNIMQSHGGLLATIVEEFYIPASFPTTQRMMFDVLKTGRKRDEFLVMASQSPEDAINCSIFPAIRDQTPTKIYLPNPSAEYESYKRCDLTLKEFTTLKSLPPDSRRFLIKQGNQSCFAVMDLYGMDDDISVLSGNSQNVAIFDDVVREVGNDPSKWMPLFQQKRTGKRA
jgi:type IV secretion system protein VirB4